MECSLSHLSGRRTCLTGLVPLAALWRFRVRAVKCWNCLLGQRPYWHISMAMARKDNMPLLDWAVNLLVCTAQPSGKVYALAPCHLQGCPSYGHFASQRPFKKIYQVHLLQFTNGMDKNLLFSSFFECLSFK